MARIEIKNNNKFKIGDTVWWFDNWGTLRTGEIYDISDEKIRDKVTTYARIYEDGEKGVCTGAKLSDCWPTKQACLDADKRRSEAQVKEYKESITDVNDLVKFLFDNDVRSENRDYDARKAAKERARELLGYEITE